MGEVKPAQISICGMGITEHERANPQPKNAAEITVSSTSTCPQRRGRALSLEAWEG